MSDKIVVSGASGTLGQLVLERLLARGHAGRVVAVTRSPAKLSAFAERGVELRAGDFDDAESLMSAFAGVERALVISTDVLDVPGHRVRQHRAAFRALAEAGAAHIAYTSIVNPERSRILISKDHADSELALRESGVSYTVLRDNIYSQMLLDNAKRAVASGKLVDAREQGKVGYVSREDVAEVAAAVLIQPPAASQVLDVTGPAALGSVEIAALLSELSGRTIAHQSIPLAALVDGMVQHGLPRPLAEIYASFDAGVAAGELAVTSDVVQRFTGRAPESLGEFLRRNRAAWAA
jgi:NAD(P)H dehydrogenase (quinone)